MALDKLVDSSQLDTDLGTVADGIRYASGGSEQLSFPAGMAAAARALKPSGTKQITTNGTHDVAGYANAQVAVSGDAPVLQSKTVTPTKSTQNVAPDSGYDGLSGVTVEPIPASYVQPSGSVNISTNGTHDVSGKASAVVNVPNPSSGSLSISANGTYDVTEKAEVVVNVSGGSSGPIETLPDQVRLSAVCNPTVVSVTISWTWIDLSFAAGIVIRRKKGSAPTNIEDGQLVCKITNTTTLSFDDTQFDSEDSSSVGTLAAPVTWYYRAFPLNSDEQGQTYIHASSNTGVLACGVYVVENATTLSTLPLETTIGFGRWRTTGLKWDIANIGNDGRIKILMHDNQTKLSLPFDAAEKAGDGNPNTDRFNYGRNVWSMSNLRQWLNATGAAGEWFAAQNDYDSLATQYNSLEGFLAGFTADERNLILPETHVCILPNVDGGGTETVVDTVWVPAEVELGDAGAAYAAEGTAMQMFTGDLNTNAQRAKNWAVIYWLRTANASSAISERNVQAAGGFVNSHAVNAYAVRAGLTLPSSTVVVWDDNEGMYVVQTA